MKPTKQNCFLNAGQSYCLNYMGFLSESYIQITMTLFQSMIQIH